REPADVPQRTGNPVVGVPKPQRREIVGVPTPLSHTRSLSRQATHSRRPPHHDTIVPLPPPRPPLRRIAADDPARQRSRRLPEQLVGVLLCDQVIRRRARTLLVLPSASRSRCAHTSHL